MKISKINLYLVNIWIVPYEYLPMAILAHGYTCLWNKVPAFEKHIVQILAVNFPLLKRGNI